MKFNPIFLLAFLLLFVSCRNNKYETVTYTAKVPFSPEYYRSIEFVNYNDSVFIIQTMDLSYDFTDIISHLTISTGKIFKIDKYFYTKDDLTGETILFSTDGDYLQFYGSRYDNLNFKKEKDDVYESDFDINEDNFRKRIYLMELAENLSSYKEMIEDVDSSRNKEIVLVNDSIVEFSNHFGLSILLYNDSTYDFTIENLLFSTGYWKFEKGCLIFDESVIFSNRNYPYEIPDKLLIYIEKNENIYTSYLVDDSTLFMGTLPFAQSCVIMRKVRPGIKSDFFNSLRATGQLPE